MEIKLKVTLKKHEVFYEPFKHIVYKDCIEGNQEDITSAAIKLGEEKKKSLVENDNYSKIEIKQSDGPLKDLFAFMSSQELADICSKHLDLRKLEPDPEYDGGGLTITGIGKFLRYHYDFPYSNVAKKYRVVNALLYLSNPKIKGGELHLLDPKTGTVEASVSPKFGTLAIFSTSDQTPHGVSKIYKHPRISINSYFYSDKPLDERIEPSKTVWLNSMEGMKH